MKVFHNKETNQVIIVLGNDAVSFYNYGDDDPLSAAKIFVGNNGNLDSTVSTCKLISIAGTPLFDIKPIIEPPTDSIGQLPNSAKRKNKQCEHSQPTNNTKQLTNSTADSTKTEQTITSIPLHPEPSETGNREEM